MGVMYTRNVYSKPLTYNLCVHYLFLFILLTGYSLMMHMKKQITRKFVIFIAYKTADTEFSLPTFDWEKRNRERGGYFCQSPFLRLNSTDLKNLVHTFLLEHAEWFSFKS